MRAAAPSSRVFRVLLLALNAAGIWWIHHDLAARPKSALRILAALPDRGVDTADRLTFVFDTPLPMSGSPGAALASSPFTITPAVAGQWFWSAPERIEFRLERPLPPGRRFTVQANAALGQLTGRTLSGPSEFKYETRSLQLTSCKPAGLDRGHTNIELRFNQPVDPADLLRHLKVTEGENSEPLETALVSHRVAEKLLVRTERPKSGRLLVTVGGSLTGSGGELSLGKDVRRDLSISATFALLGAEPLAGGLGATSTARIRFTKPLHAEGGVLPRVAVEPAVARLQTHVEDDTVVLEAPFESGKTYTATFGDDIASTEKEKLEPGSSVSFTIPDRAAAIAFTASDGILSPAGNLLVDLQVVNVPAVRLRAARVHANNLVSHLHNEHRRAETSRELPEKTVHIDGRPNVPTKVSVDLRQMLGEPLGIYHLDAEGPEGSWIETSAVVAVTDLAITSKHERDGLCVWVTSLRTARPVADATVTALSFNGQVLASACTSTDGIARLSVPANHPDGAPWAITAARGEDMSFLRPEDSGWGLDGSESGVNFCGRPIPLSYDVMLYTERGVYRPGDTLHVTGLIRDIAGQIPPAFPLAVTVQRPDGREVAQLTTTAAAGEQGFFHVEYKAPEAAQTGRYAFRVGLPGSKDALGSVDALVEEYVPLRLELKTKPAQPRFVGMGAPSVEVAARYLFDQPGSGLPVRVVGKYRHQPFVSKQFAEFEFDPACQEQHEIAEREAKLDEHGRANIALDAPPANVPGCWQAEANVTVSEQGGRSVSDRVQAVVDIADRHVGVHLPGGHIVQVGTPAAVEWVQLTGNDRKAEYAASTCSLVRVEYDTALRWVDGYRVWKSVERMIPVSEMELPAYAEKVGRFEIACPTPGLYRLRVTDCQSGIVGQTELHAVASVDAAFMTALKEPERLSLALDKDTYSPGAAARLVVKSPFAGTMLLTVETDRVVDCRVLPMVQSSMEINVPVDPALRGGAFISATVIREIDPADTSWLPHRAMGMIRLRTDHVQHDLPLTIAAPQEARPGQLVSVRVQTSPPVDPQQPPMVHVWAVDEGILLATAYATPRPADYFFAPREAGVTSADVFDELMPDYQRPAEMSRIGAGDSGDEFRRRLAPVPTPRREPAVVWRTAAAVNADGTLSVEMPLPELTGKLRLMAVAAEADRYGQAEQALVVTSPLLVEMTCPRFAAPGDRFEIPTKVFNTTGESLDVSLVHNVDGPVRLDVTTTRPAIRLESKQSTIVWTRAEAMGLGPVHVSAVAQATSASGEALKSKQEAAFAVRPGGPLHAQSTLVRVTAGEPYRIEPAAGFVPGTARTSVCISARPTVQLMPAVQQLLDYPYGCVEQTSSRMYALLYAPDLLQQTGDVATRTKAAGELFESGLARLWSMQTRSGGFSYWPGDAQPNMWATVYVAELLVRAQRAGYKLDADGMAALSKFLQNEVKDASRDECDGNLRAHMCHVLSAMKQPPQSWMARLSEAPGELDMAGQAHLACAWLEAGRKDRAAAILNDDTLGQTVASTTGGCITSQVQQEAVLLNCLLDLDPRHAWIPSLVQRLEKARHDGQWGSTLENACALMALMRYQNTATQPAVFEGTIRQAEWSQSFDQRLAQTFKRSSDAPIELESKGQGDLYLAVTTEGLLAEGQEEAYDRQLCVSRRWLDRKGKPLNVTHVRVGDLILVETTLAAGPGAGDVENVAVVDALPGGCEVENPRLAGSELAGSGPSAGTLEDDPDHVEFRDDRVLIFTTASPGQKVFRYALRAVTAGSFSVPPVQASCMYDAAFASVQNAGKVEIAR